MRQILYRIIYNRSVNFILRNLNRFILPVLPWKIRISPSGILVLKIDGRSKIRLATNQTNYLTYLIYWEGGYRNFEYTDIFIKLIKKIKIFYDVGANIGYYSLLGAMVNRSLRVVAFEPASGPAYFFKKNIELNSLTNVTLEEIALSDDNGVTDFYEIKNKKYKYLKHNLGGESNIGSKTTGRNFEVVKVSTTTLDEYAAAINEQGIDLIKMDTEGTEFRILDKCDKILKQMKPIIICETIFNSHESELEDIMNRYGYEFYGHIPQGLKKLKTLKRDKYDGIDNCFFVHPDKTYLIKEFIVG